MPVYLGALAFGGTLLIATLVLGLGHHDVDHQADHDAAAELGWLPVTSIRFWTFLLGFGGLTGTALTYLGSGRVITAIAAATVGWLSGVGMVAVMRKVKSGPGSEVSAKDLRGETAEVLVAIAPGTAGKVRVTAKGRIFDLIAESDDRSFAIGDKVMIVGEGADGRVNVGES